jgi:hypothetical protein
MLKEEEEALLAKLKGVEDVQQRLALGAVLACQEQHEQMIGQYREEVRQIELKYEGLVNENSTRVNRLVNGGLASRKECFKPELYAPEGVQPLKPVVPEFWARVLAQSNVELGPQDPPVLRHLREVTRRRDGDWEHFEFLFEKNDFFTNERLVKRVQLEQDFREEGTSIEWCPGKAILCGTRIRKVKQRNKKGEVRIVEKQEKGEPSFF